MTEVQQEPRRTTTSEAQVYSVGDRVWDEMGGSGTVGFVNAAQIGVEFEDGRKALFRASDNELRRWDAALGKALSEVKAEETKQPPALPWPESTFVDEPPNAEHGMGSRWDPFFEDRKDFFRKLPAYVSEAGLEEELNESLRKTMPAVPNGWPVMFHLAWPTATRDVLFVIRVREQSNEIVSIYPRWSLGCEHTMTLSKVFVWESACEAQIEATLGNAEIVFFDTHFGLHRGWYRKGDKYQFLLTGIAYHAQPAEIQEFTIRRSPEEQAAMRWLMGDKGPDENDLEDRYCTRGMAALMPITEWDKDDYSFRGPIRSVKEVNMLGNRAWLVRATVLRPGGYKTEDVDLDIVVTERIWKGDSAPEVGQDIEGTLWLQGRLWYPHAWHKPNY